MIRFTRTAKLRNTADTMAAAQYGATVNAYVNEKYGLNMQFGIELFGTGRMCWTVEVESLSKIEEVNGALMGDEAYWAMVQGGRELWLDGSLEDTCYTIVG